MLYVSTNSLSPRRPYSGIQTLQHPAFVVSPAARFSSVVRQSGRTAEFWGSVLRIWASLKVAQIYISFQKRHRDEDWVKATWEKEHGKAGDRMVKLCTDMKGFYVKAGQLISMQAFTPAIIKRKLSLLHDNMPAMPAELAKEVISDELRKLGKSVDVFDSLDLNNVLGSASIAQVHRGVLRSGKLDVAVKVQFPNMERLMMSDLANFRLLAEILQRTELKFDLSGPVQELAKQVSMEFDFELEARGMTEIRTSLRGVKGVNIPRVIPGLVSRRLLVMTYLDGLPMTQLEGKLDKNPRIMRTVGRKILKKLSQSYGKMILSDGFFQADCHPGNILVMNSRMDIGILDFGQTKRFSEESRLGFARLVDAMARRKSSEIGMALENLGIKVEHVPMTKKLKSKNRKSRLLTPEFKLAYTMFDTAVLDGVSDNPFSDESALRSGSVSSFPKDLFFLLRTMQILRGICKVTSNSDYSVISSWASLAKAEIKRAPPVQARLATGVARER